MTTNNRAERISAETFSAPFTLAKADSAARTFKGVASVFGAPIDTYPPTIIERGAFTKTLAEQGGRVKILWQHDTSEPIGRPLSLVESSEGLEIVGKLDPIPLGERAMTQIKSGTLTDLSIGFDPVEWHLVQGVAGGEPTRMLTEVKLWEISVVTFGAQRGATLTAHARQMARDREQKMREIEQAWLEREREQICERGRNLKILELDAAAQLPRVGGGR